MLLCASVSTDGLIPADSYRVAVLRAKPRPIAEYQICTPEEHLNIQPVMKAAAALVLALCLTTLFAASTSARGERDHLLDQQPSLVP